MSSDMYYGVCIRVLYCENHYVITHVTHTYHKLWSTSTGTSIRRLRIFVAQIMWGTYNHGVLFNEIKYMVVQQHAY